MKQSLLLTCVLLLGTYGYAQQPGQSPGATPPTFPTDNKADRPSSGAPQANASQPTSGEVQQQIDQKLAQEPGLKNTDVRFDVNDTRVVVSGTVNDEQQHQLAIRLAQSYAGNRKITDYVKIRGGK